VRHTHKRGRHGRRRFPDGNDVQGTAGEDVGDPRILQGAREHATSAHRVDSGAGDGEQVCL
jgi:hypothetical protein